jgi:acylphosphatase
MSTAQAVRAVVRGRVQGVGFRDATVRRARGLGVTGWVRNGEDGEVLVHAEGTAEAVKALEAFLREGPRGAHVEDVAAERVKVEGHEQFAVRGVPAGRFVVRALERGFELALEVDGALRAWSVPKGPSMDPADKRFAVEAAVSEVGELWDAGPYEQGGRVSWPEALDRGHAVFVLHGERLRGGFALQRTGGSKWLLVKRRDEHAAT